ncbi:MAG: PKD domain-containing protein, partial [Chloroflexota bacterium]|nr:PKD domain-containing protein [Chloroflexota bacterium]
VSAVSSNPGDTVMLDGSGSSDPDGDTINAKWEQIEGTTATIVAPDQLVTKFQMPEARSKPLKFKLTVTDQNGAFHSAEVTANRKPVANAGKDKKAIIGETVTLDAGESYDPDNETIGFVWDQLGGPDVTLSDRTAKRPTFIPESLGNHTFEVRVTDIRKGVATARVVITVAASNAPPVAIASASHSVANPGDTVTLNGSGSYDPDGDNLEYKWKQAASVGGGSIELSDDTIANPTFTVPPGQSALTFNLTVTDTAGVSSMAAVSVTVNAPPSRMPVRMPMSKSIPLLLSMGPVAATQIINSTSSVSTASACGIRRHDTQPRPRGDLVPGALDGGGHRVHPHRHRPARGQRHRHRHQDGARVHLERVAGRRST